MTAEHRKPLAAFVLVFAAACLIMGNGLRTQVVEVLIEAGAPNGLVNAIAPDMVLSQSLSSAPQPQAVRKVPAKAKDAVKAGENDRAPSGPASPIQSAVESTVSSSTASFAQSPAEAAAQQAAATSAHDRRARSEAGRARARASQEPADARRGPARAAPAPRFAARHDAKPAAAEPALAPRPTYDKGAGKAEPAAGHDKKRAPAPRRLTSQHGDQTVAKRSRAPHRSSHDAHGKHSRDESRGHSREARGKAHRGSGNDHHGRRGHRPSGHRH